MCAGGKVAIFSQFFSRQVSFFHGAMVTTRNSTSVCTDAAPQPEAATVVSATADTCAICLTSMATGPTVTTFCGHRFHAQCAVNALQFNHRCPVCRHDQREKKAEPDDDDLYEDGYIDRCENIVHARLMHKATAGMMRQLLKDFDVPDAELRNASKRKLADMLAEQMLYETDDDDDGDGDGDGDGEIDIES